MTRTKYLDFKVTNKEWELGKPFLALPTIYNNGKTGGLVKALAGWTPHRYKSIWKIRLINSKTRERKAYKLVEVRFIENWLIVIWNPYEAIDAIMDIIPTVVATGMMAGVLSQLVKEPVDTTNDVNKLKEV